MAPPDKSQIIAELNKLRKSELVDIIVHKKLPEGVAGSDALDVVLKSFGGFVSVADNKAANAVKPQSTCAGCQGLQREIGVYERLCYQLEQRTRDQADLIDYLKVSASTVCSDSGENRKKSKHECSVTSKGEILNCKDGNSLTEKGADMSYSKKQSADNPQTKISGVKSQPSSKTPTADRRINIVNNNTGSVDLIDRGKVSAGVLLAETRAVMDEYVNLTSQDTKGKWHDVKNKKRRRAVLVGSNHESSTVRGVPSYVHLHVYRVDPETTTEKLTTMLKSSFPEVKCEALTPRHPEIYASFKVSVYGSSFKAAMDASRWPHGACISRFFSPRRDKNVKEK